MSDSYSEGFSNASSASEHKTQVLESNAQKLCALEQLDPELVNTITKEDLNIIISHLDDRTLSEWLSILHEANVHHADDECIPQNRLKLLLELEAGPAAGVTEKDWELLVRVEAFVIHEWSIYPEVRNVTRPIDEEDDDDYETLRMYVLSITWACSGCVLDTFFAVRYPAISISGGAVQLLIAGSGHLWARLPRVVIPLGSNRRVVLNNGKPWTYKEQMLATLAMSVSLGAPYSQYVVLSMANSTFYGFSEAGSFGFAIMLTLGSAFMGFGFAGILRSFVVYPVRMVWFDCLPYLSLARTLTGTDTERENINGWKLKRYEFFWLFAWLNFGWYWITNFVFTALSNFDWIAWIAPMNVNVQAITGSINGLGVNPVSTFDTNVISFTSLFTPWPVIETMFWAMVYSTFAVVIIWYTNVRWTGYLPINSNKLYDNEGKPYQVRRILNESLELDLEKYQSYSLPLWTAGNLVNFGAQFMFFPGMIAYTVLNYWKYYVTSVQQFGSGLRNAGNLLHGFNDTFSRRMRRYKEVPEWWYMLTMTAAFGIAVACVEYFRFTHCPVWTIVLGIGLSVIFLVPSNTLRARTTNTFSINVLFELIVGYLLPLAGSNGSVGNGLMVSKQFATMFASQADNYVSNQAQAHYAGICPRALFRAQMLSVVCSSFVQVSLLTWQASGALGPSFCTFEDSRKFYCQGVRTFFNSAVQWGTIGPQRVFQAIYPQLKWCFLIGAVYPVPFWAARKLLPKYAGTLHVDSRRKLWALRASIWLRDFNEMVFLNGAAVWAPSNWYYTLGNLYVGILWHKWIRPRYPLWWAKYTNLFYNAVSVGVAFAGLFAFFATEYRHPVSINWWGNTVNDATGDSQGGLPRLSLAQGEYFGPRRGQFP